MSRSRRAEEPAASHPLLTVPRKQFESELDERIARGEELLTRDITSRNELDAARSDFYTWDEYNTDLLNRRLTASEVADGYSHWGGGVFALEPSLAKEVRDCLNDVEEKLRRLKSIKGRIPLFDETPQALSAHEPAKTAARSQRAGPIDSIFIVHGHDEALQLAVHGFLRQVTDLEPLILHDQPNRGRTIIEKFEAVGSGAGFAIVLFTADDVGAGVEAKDALQSRARQNVVWEFGFFAGALGRSHVVVIYEDGVELPSDLHGLVYIPYDAGGGWKLLLARELKAAGIEVDAAKLI